MCGPDDGEKSKVLVFNKLRTYLFKAGLSFASLSIRPDSWSMENVCFARPAELDGSLK